MQVLQFNVHTSCREFPLGQKSKFMHANTK